ncbi:phosphatidylglycerol lysyltransferase [Spirochaeta dissipatitropha]
MNDHTDNNSSPIEGLSAGHSFIKLPDLDSVDFSELLNTAIISSSGWRFIAAPDGEEDDSEELSEAGAALVWLMSNAIAEYFIENHGKSCRLLLACDSRPTGASAASIVMRVCTAHSIDIRYAFICASPELMAYASADPEANGFIYISASHNPVGYNGFKLGGSGGGVFSGTESEILSSKLFRLAQDRQSQVSYLDAYNQVSAQKISELLEQSPIWKKAAMSAYHNWTNIIAFDNNDNLSNQLREQISRQPIGIVQDMNGSARCCSIDDEYFSGLGCKIHGLNPGVRNFTHAIVPEGDSLIPCQKELERVHESEPEYIIGYVPDNDGDRGNLVIHDGKKARTVGGQEVFALGMLAELTWLVYSGQISYDNQGKLTTRAAVVVNCATSLRIDTLCAIFGVEIFRAEVGEANVVELAEKLRAKGYIVRILGEGSNGGTILHPARIRDPLNTLTSLIKFLRLPPNPVGKTPWLIWRELRMSYAQQQYENDYNMPEEGDLNDALNSIPVFQTTGAYEDRAVIRGTSKNHGRLKEEYEKLLLEYWERNHQKLLERYGFFTFRVFNTEGTELRGGMGKEYRRGNQSGGFTVLFKDSQGKPLAFFWMRGSKTEPVFRIMTDIESRDPRDEIDLFNDHREMVMAANKAAIQDEQEQT